MTSGPQAAFARAIAQLGEKELEPGEWVTLVANVNGARGRSYLPAMLTAFLLSDYMENLPTLGKAKEAAAVDARGCGKTAQSRGFYRLYRVPGWQGLVKRALWLLRLRGAWPYSRLDRWVHVRNEAFLSKAKYWVGGRHLVGLGGHKAPAPPGYATRGGAA